MLSCFRRLAVAAAALLPLAAAQPARAQDSGQGSGLSFYASPYLWIAGLSGTITTPYQRLPQQDIDVSFGDTLSNLSGFAFMGAAEIRYGRFGLIGDVMVLNVESDVSTAGRLFAGGTARVTTTTGTILGMIRVMEDADSSLDIGGGVRPWSVSAKLTLDPGLLAGRSLSPSLSWTDPLLAVRYIRRFNERWGATVYGDIGGFDAGSEITWQLMGTVDYRFSDTISIRAGYRHLQMQHDKHGTQIDIGLSGPIFGATMRF